MAARAPPPSDPSELDSYGASFARYCLARDFGVRRLSRKAGTLQGSNPPPRSLVHVKLNDYPSSLILPFHQPRYATHLRPPLPPRDAASLSPSTPSLHERGRGGERGRPPSSSSPSCRAAWHPSAAAAPDSAPARAGAAPARRGEVAHRCQRRARLHFSEVVVPQTRDYRARI